MGRFDGVDVSPRKKPIKIVEYVNYPRELDTRDVHLILENVLNTPGAKVMYLEKVISYPEGSGSAAGEDVSVVYTGDGTEEEVLAALTKYMADMDNR